MKAVLLDIEGTTTDIKFVHNVLFPYSQRHFPDFLKEKENEPTVSKIIAEIKSSYLSENSSLEDIIDQINQWITQDQKIPQLKQLQGLIWEDGYIHQEYVGHLYPEVFAKLTEWKERGLKLYIYSSGSVKAQKLLFAHTAEGDLTHLFDDYFDTQVGHKKEPQSYLNILKSIQQNPHEVVFLSDNPEELDAAQVAGIKTYHLNRDGLYHESNHKIIETFNEVNFE